jgi:hypothetical protein
MCPECGKAHAPWVMTCPVEHVTWTSTSTDTPPPHAEAIRFREPPDHIRKGIEKTLLEIE